MIRRVALENWRAYERAEIPFEPGTTFIVAPNGIGKSSLLEAAHFAISGELDSAVSPVSLGATRATAEVSLEMPGNGTVVVIRRTITTAGEIDLKMTINDEEIAAADYVAELDRGFRATPEFLARNALLRDGLREIAHPDLRTLLSRAFDLGRKRAEAEQLATLAADHFSAAEALSKAIRSEERQAGRVETELDTAQTELAQAEEKLSGARTQVEALTEARDLYLEQAALAKRLAAWEESAAALLIDARAHVSTTDVDSLAEDIEGALSEAEAELERESQRAALVRAQIDMIEAAKAELDSAHANCPVCRRPLLPEDRTSAQAGHDHDLAGLADELAASHVDRERGRVEQLRALNRQVAALGARPFSPAAGLDLVDPQPAFDAARADLERASAAHQEAKTRVSTLTEALESARAVEEKAARSVRAWRRWALTQAASDALLASIDDVLTQEVQPVQRAVARRWNGLFVNRPDLQFDLDGELWRGVDGHRLPLAGFSAGETTAARLLMQLAILTTATTADFCWFDEPLETLDPRTRRRVAAMLAQGRKATGLRQLVITTYEEDLAAQLAQAEPNTRVEYVRAGPMVDGADN